MEALTRQRMVENLELRRKKLEKQARRVEKETRRAQREMRRKEKKKLKDKKGKAAMQDKITEGVAPSVELQFLSPSLLASGPCVPSIVEVAKHPPSKGGIPCKPPLPLKTTPVGGSTFRGRATCSTASTTVVATVGNLESSKARASASRGKTTKNKSISRANVATRESSRSPSSSIDFRGSWGLVSEVPEYEVNSLAAPTGDYWDHMRQYAFDQACWEFPWHLNWNKQCSKLKTRFILQLRQLYPRPWES
jgi:hypothetical protein